MFAQDREPQSIFKQHLQNLDDMLAEHEEQKHAKKFAKGKSFDETNRFSKFVSLPTCRSTKMFQRADTYPMHLPPNYKQVYDSNNYPPAIDPNMVFKDADGKFRFSSNY